jgi:glutamyl-tRNA synthetase
LLGWSPKENREKLPIEEIVRLFDLPQILRHNARFDIDKLHWLDGEYIREMGDDRFRDLGAQALQRAGYPIDTYSAAYISAAMATCKGKIKRFGELAAYGGFYFTDEITFTPETEKEFTPECKARLATLRSVYADLKDFTAAALEPALKSTAKETLKIKAGLLIHPLRLACTGATAGPSLYHLMEVLGRERVFQRLDRVIKA